MISIEPSTFGLALILNSISGKIAFKSSRNKFHFSLSLNNRLITFLKTVLESPFAAIFLTAPTVRISSSNGIPAKPGTYIQKGFSSDASRCPMCSPSKRAARFLFFPFLKVAVTLSPESSVKEIVIPFVISSFRIPPFAKT